MTKTLWRRLLQGDLRDSDIVWKVWIFRCCEL